MIVIGFFAVAGLLASVAEPDGRSEIENGLRGAVVFEGETQQRYDLAERMAHYNTPGLSLTLIEDGEIAWTAGYGLLEADGKEAVDADTLFQAGSIAKPVAAFSALRMAEAGLIDLDVDVSTYLERYTLPDGAQTAENPVTLRHLLAHTAGITPGGYAGYAQGEALPSDVQILTGEAPANREGLQIDTAPGERLAYSGHGYTLAELVLQEVSGQAFAPLMDAWVFEPLKLEGLSFAMPLPSEQQGFTARGHDTAGAQVEGGWRNHPEQAAAGLWATSQDLAKLLIALHEAYHHKNHDKNPVLSQPGMQMFWGEEREEHTFGWVIRNEDFLMHGGSTVGYRATVLISPQTGDGAVVLTNSDNGGGLVAEVLRSASDYYGWSTFTPVVHTRFTPEDGVIAKRAGRYAFDAGWVVTIEHDAQADQLTVVFPNGDRYDLAATGPGAFIHPPTGVTVSFSEDAGRSTLELYGQTAIREAD